MNEKNQSNNKVRTVFFIVINVICMIGFAFYFGCIPGITLSSTGINYSLAGQVAQANPMIVSNVLYPYGGVLFEGYGISFIASLFNLICNNSIWAITCTYLLIFIVSYISITWLLKQLTDSYLVTQLFVIIYFLNPYFSKNLGVSQVGFGAMLVAFSLVADYWILKKIMIEKKQTKLQFKESLKKNIGVVAVLVGNRFIVVSMGWYVAVIVAVLSCLFSLCYMILCIKDKGVKKSCADYLIYIVFPWFISMLFFYFITPSATSDFSSSMEFYNGSSVDVVTMLLPNATHFISKIFPSVEKFIPQGYTLVGDISFWNNYIGYALLLAAFGGIFSRAKHSKIRISMTVTMLVGLVLALGPGLKILGTTIDDGVLLYEDYCLPLENMLIFPWKNIYRIFPISMMRAVSRWILIPRIIIILFAAIFIGYLWKKGKKYKWLVILFGCIAVLEYYPVNGVSEKFAYYDQTLEVRKDVVEPLKERLEEDDIVAVCMYDKNVNGYLVPYIMSEVDAITYAGSGDKAMVLAKKYMPEDILNLQGSEDADEIAAYISEVANKKLCDYVLIPYFDMCNNSYNWAISDEQLKVYMDRAQEVERNLNNQYKIFKEESFMLVEVKDDNNTAGYELINDHTTEYVTGKDKNSLFGTYMNYKFTADNLFETEIELQNEENQLYIQMYPASKNKSSITCVIEEYDLQKNKIGEMKIPLQVKDEYKLYEFESNLDKNTRYTKLSLVSQDEYLLKNFKVHGFVSEQHEYNGEKVIFDGKSALIMKDIPSTLEITNLDISMDLYLDDENNKEYSIINKMHAWADEMTFNLLKKDGYYIFAMTEDGFSNVNIYLQETEMDVGKWNNVHINFSNGETTVSINGKESLKEKLEIQQLYWSIEDISVGEGMFGKIKNLRVDYF